MKRSVFALALLLLAAGSFALSQDISNQGTVTSAIIAGTTSNVTTSGTCTITTTGTCTLAATSKQMLGTATGDAASAGNLGQVITNNASGVTLTSTQATTITSIPLTAGDWDVYASITFAPAGTTTMTQLIASISASTSLDASLDRIAALVYPSGTVLGTNTPTAKVSGAVFQLGSDATHFLVARGDFGVSTLTASGKLWARRRR